MLVTISIRQFTFTNQYNYHYRIKMMDFLQPCSLTEKFIIVSVNTNINMVGFRVLYLYDVLIQPSSNITSPTITYCRQSSLLQHYKS